MAYEYVFGFRKGAFQALLSLRNVIEHFQTSEHSKLIPKKVYKLLYSYLDECCHNVDEFLEYAGLPNVIIDKNNICKMVSEEEAETFRRKCRKQYEDKKE